MKTSNILLIISTVPSTINWKWLQSWWSLRRAGSGGCNWSIVVQQHHAFSKDNIVAGVGDRIPENGLSSVSPSISYILYPLFSSVSKKRILPYPISYILFLLRIHINILYQYPLFCSVSESISYINILFLCSVPKTGYCHILYPISYLCSVSSINILYPISYLCSVSPINILYPISYLCSVSNQYPISYILFDV